ncbi:hypothetical protein L9F63_017503, partial [Diploptera punctata]
DHCAITVIFEDCFPLTHASDTQKNELHLTNNKNVDNDQSAIKYNTFNVLVATIRICIFSYYTLSLLAVLIRIDANVIAILKFRDRTSDLFMCKTQEREKRLTLKYLSTSRGTDSHFHADPFSNFYIFNINNRDEVGA